MLGIFIKILLVDRYSSEGDGVWGHRLKPRSGVCIALSFRLDGRGSYILAVACDDWGGEGYTSLECKYILVRKRWLSEKGNSTPSPILHTKTPGNYRYCRPVAGIFEMECECIHKHLSFSSQSAKRFICNWSEKVWFKFLKSF